MNMPHDDDIDALLRQSFGGAVPDDGFADQVMQQLPPRRRRSAWPLVAGVCTGAILCALCLLDSPLLRVAWQGWRLGQWSTASVVTLVIMAAMSLLALGWTLAEADDR